MLKKRKLMKTEWGLSILVLLGGIVLLWQGLDLVLEASKDNPISMGGMVIRLLASGIGFGLIVVSIALMGALRDKKEEQNGNK